MPSTCAPLSETPLSPCCPVLPPDAFPGVVQRSASPSTSRLVPPILLPSRFASAHVVTVRGVRPRGSSPPRRFELPAGSQACCILQPTMRFIGFPPPPCHPLVVGCGLPRRCLALQSLPLPCSRTRVTASPCPPAVQAAACRPRGLAPHESPLPCAAIADRAPPVALLGFPSWSHQPVLPMRSPEEGRLEAVPCLHRRARPKPHPPPPTWRLHTASPLRPAPRPRPCRELVTADTLRVPLYTPEGAHPDPAAAARTVDLCLTRPPSRAPRPRGPRRAAPAVRRPNVLGGSVATGLPRHRASLRCHLACSARLRAPRG
jgi:hypothetical protein